ncbi:bifunctional methylenetetrahydrofolate dehydrogenase/methenyltetrahydrofolate cyclohydrolase [Christensenellaceae bacterium OttesenSCG-928-L17]|nr:bifunctional methylenetetrahydrofolate dehydrogenase/methenyltetrahydrofolate cyclohydrolase [Christensenellaceae bacterium OttesenSCG-928-L17]
MGATIIDGKAQAQAVCAQLQKEISALISQGTVPGLSVILVGDDPASSVYVRNKEKRAAELGMHGQIIRMPADISQAALLEKIQALNNDPGVHGILVQLPLPAHICAQTVAAAVAPEKDVDGLHPENLGNLFAGHPTIVPCTPLGIQHLIKSTGVPLSGAHAVVIGRSNIVGKPVSMLLQMEHATVTMCHSRTKDLPALCRQADILVSAVGVRNLVRGDMVKPGAVVIDVGTNRNEGVLCGDVAFDEAKEVAGYITPVPGGVGPMTIAMLMQNTVQAAREAAKKE